MPPKISKQMRRILFFRTTPGWRRVLSAALIAPLVTPIACISVWFILEFEENMLNFDPELEYLLLAIFATTPLGYAATLLLGLPICLGLAHVGLAGIIPVIGVGLGFGFAIGYWWMPPDVTDIASIASGFTVSGVAWIIAYWGWWR